MKKVLCLLLCLPLLLVPLSVSAEETALSLNCRAAILVDVDTGLVLYEKEADKSVSPASITKVMSILLIMEALSSGALHLEDRVTASAHASSMGGSQIWLEHGEEMSVDELLRAAMIGSANDATVALAEAVAGSEEAFVQRMNEKAAELQMTHTHFCNASGLDAETHLTTARDIATMCRALLAYPEVQKYSTTWMDELRDGKTQLVNTNKLVHSYEGITGLKTGTTGKAGRCLAASAEREGFHVLAVIMGCDQNEDRYGGAEKMLNWAFANYEAVVPKDGAKGLEPLKVLCGKEERVAVYADITKPVVLEKGKKEQLTYQITLAKDVLAPVEEGQCVGKVEVLSEGKILSEYPILCAKSVECMTFQTAFVLFWKDFVNIF